MSKKTIAIDIDDVLAANAEGFVEFSNQKWGTRLHPDDYNDHWAKLWDVDNNTALERADMLANKGFFGKLQHFDEATYVLKKLKTRYRLIIVTARRISAEQDTREWIDRYFPDIFEEIHFAGIWDEMTAHAHQTGKGGFVKNLDADYLIDDQTKHCISAAELGVQSILYGNYTWNQADQLPPGVTRLVSWAEIGEYFEAKQ